MSNAKIIAGGLLFTAGHCIPIFRSGGRTRLTFWEWIINHTIFGPPVEYVPEEDYARELEGVKPVSIHAETEVLEEVMAYYQISEPSARKLLGEDITMISHSSLSELTGTSVSELVDALNLMESSLEYGEKAKLQITSEDLPTREELDEAYSDLISVGFHVSRPVTRIIDSLPVTEIVLTKGSPVWALLIPLIPTVLIVGLIAFGIVKIEAITKALMPLLLVAGGITIAALVVATRPAPMKVVEKAVERYGRS